jgi:hypothetical protein
MPNAKTQRRRATELRTQTERANRRPLEWSRSVSSVANRANSSEQVKKAEGE